MALQERILVFGTGFIGKNVLASRPNNLFIVTVSRGNDCIYSDKHLQANINDYTEVERCINENKINKVFFLIGPSFPSISFNNVEEDINIYLKGIIWYFNRAKNLNIDEITLLSSAGTVYGSDSEQFFQEDTSFNLKSSYSILSKAIENYLIIYSKNLNFNFRVYRLSNVYGKFHTSKHNGFINIAIRKGISRELVQVFNSEISKDYIYSDDVARVFWELNKIDKTNFIVNICSGHNASIKELSEEIYKHMPEIKLQEINTVLDYDSHPPKLKNDKLKSLINFNFTSISEGIKKTIEWEKSHS